MHYGFLWFSDTQRILEMSVSVFYEVRKGLAQASWDLKRGSI
jgi:hypothetical protein